MRKALSRGQPAGEVVYLQSARRWANAARELLLNSDADVQRCAATLYAHAVREFGKGVLVFAHAVAAASDNSRLICQDPLAAAHAVLTNLEPDHAWMRAFLEAFAMPLGDVEALRPVPDVDSDALWSSIHDFEFRVSYALENGIESILIAPVAVLIEQTTAPRYSSDPLLDLALKMQDAESRLPRGRRGPQGVFEWSEVGFRFFVEHEASIRDCVSAFFRIWMRGGGTTAAKRHSKLLTDVLQPLQPLLGHLSPEREAQMAATIAHRPTIRPDDCINIVLAFALEESESRVRKARRLLQRARRLLAEGTVGSPAPSHS